MKETDLYPAVKRFLEGQGYSVKAEVNDCDIVAVRGEEPPVLVELKTSMNLTVILQAIDRQAMSDDVYVAVPTPTGKSANSLWRRNRRGIVKLCRRLGLGLITVDLKRKPERAVEVHLDPAPYQPRKDKKRAGRLLKEFSMRVGDPNMGGSTNRPLITAYRQDALRCLFFLKIHGTGKVVDIRTTTGVERAGPILLKDHYGWFERVDRGLYTLSPKGTMACEDYAWAEVDL